MNQDNPIRTAIDESLSGVRFDAKDMRAVLRAAKKRGKKPAPRAPRARSGFALAMAMVLVLVVPAGFFALRAQGMRTAKITAISGVSTLAPQTTADPQADLIISAATDGYTAEESEAIRLARVCFESVCDTGLFTFEEYAVSVSRNEAAEYTVSMDCIYGNGCSFTAVVSPKESRVISHSAPALATTPAYLDSSAPQVAAWYDKYGPYIITWPQDAQAEFSRRYEGGMLRAAEPGELAPADAVVLAKDHLRAQLPSSYAGAELYGYAMLYAERASADGMARYVVSVYDHILADSLPEPLGTVSFRTDGSEAKVVSSP